MLIETAPSPNCDPPAATLVVHSWSRDARSVLHRHLPAPVEWGLQPGTGGRPVEVVSVPSVPLPRYREVRLALPRPGSIHDLIKRFKPDLVHCATEFGVGRMGQIAAARAGLPLVSSYHTDFARYADAYGTSWLRGAVSSYLGRFHRRSRRVFTPSTISRQDLVRLEVANVEVWGRGVDAELFHPGRRSQAMRAALGMGSRFTFVYVGRLAPEKRAEQIIHAFRLASESLPRGVIHLLMAGTGRLSDRNTRPGGARGHGQRPARCGRPGWWRTRSSARTSWI